VQAVGAHQNAISRSHWERVDVGWVHVRWLAATDSDHPMVRTPLAAVTGTAANGRAAGPLSTAPVSALN
jgi:hypothetical protein